jgi:hypothetical protein
LSNKESFYFDALGNSFKHDTPDTSEIFTGIIGKESFLLKKKQIQMSAGNNYLLSFWYYNEGELRTQNKCYIHEFDSAGNSIQIIEKPVSDSYYIDGNWTLAELSFKPAHDNPYLSVSMQGSKRSSMNYYMHSLMILEEGTSVYKVLKEENGKVKTLLKNNMLIRN